MYSATVIDPWKRMRDCSSRSRPVAGSCTCAAAAVRRSLDTSMETVEEEQRRRACVLVSRAPSRRWWSMLTTTVAANKHTTEIAFRLEPSVVAS
eukprot:scaffold37385_cov44-Phaeocystis_antarctica.AAC.2